MSEFAIGHRGEYLEFPFYVSKLTGWGWVRDLNKQAENFTYVVIAVQKYLVREVVRRLH